MALFTPKISTGLSSRVLGTLYEWSEESWSVWRTSPGPKRAWPWVQSISVLTYNVGLDGVYPTARAFAIVGVLSEHHPDVAAFQEVASDVYGSGLFWDVLNTSAIVRKEYVISMLEEQMEEMWDIGGTSHGTVLLVRKAVAAEIPSLVLWYQRLTSSQDRCLTGIDFCNHMSQVLLTVSTAHFENESWGAGGPVHRLQYREVLDALSGDHAAVVMGDFNIGRNLRSLEIFASSSFVDVWKECHRKFDEVSGATYGVLYPESAIERRPQRLDFIFARGMETSLCDLVGASPIAGLYELQDDGSKRSVYPSSHVGVFAHLLLGSPDDASQNAPSPYSDAPQLRL